METYTNIDFKNQQLNFDFGKITNYEWVDIKKDKTELSFTVEVNDNSYFYDSETERDYDFDFLSYIFSAQKTKNKTENLSSYLETHFEVVQYITDCLDRQGGDDRLTNMVVKRNFEQGSGGIYLLAKEWTDKFTEQYKDVAWGEESESGILEYYDTIEEFLTQQNKL